MQTCQNCGTQVPDEGRFCPECGSAVGPAIPSAQPVPQGEPQYAPQPAPQYAPAAQVMQPVEKKSRKGLIIGIAAVVLITLLSCCGVGAWAAINYGVIEGPSVAGDADSSKVEAIQTFAVGLGALDFDMIRSVTMDDVHDEIALVEEAVDADREYWTTSTLRSSEVSEPDGVLLMTFEDTDGYVSYIRVYPPSDGGMILQVEDWDDEMTEENATATTFQLIDDGGWKVYSIDGDTLDVFFGQ